MSRTDLVVIVVVASVIMMHVFVRTKWAKENASVNNNGIIALGTVGTVALAFGEDAAYWAGVASLGSVVVWAYVVDAKRRRREAKKQELSG